ncbi:UNVERIFIED_CONTAM: putative ribonuclease H protein, partial [Sesamum latifolium]
RNNAKHGEIGFKTESIIFRICEHLHLLQKANLWKPYHWKAEQNAAEKLGNQVPKIALYKGIRLIFWEKPEEGWVKLNTDGASRGNPGVTGAGGIIRNHFGEVLLAFQEPSGITSNIQAELSALHRSLLICKERVYIRVWIELDALSVLKLLKKPLSGAWQYQVILQQIFSLLKSMKTKLSQKEMQTFLLIIDSLLSSSLSFTATNSEESLKELSELTPSTSPTSEMPNELCSSKTSSCPVSGCPLFSVLFFFFDERCPLYSLNSCFMLHYSNSPPFLLYRLNSQTATTASTIMTCA